MRSRVASPRTLKKLSMPSSSSCRGPVFAARTAWGWWARTVFAVARTVVIAHSFSHLNNCSSVRITGKPVQSSGRAAGPRRPSALRYALCTFPRAERGENPRGAQPAENQEADAERLRKAG